MAGMVVQHNMNALNSYNRLNFNVSSMKKSAEKLSSGYRINRAGDDAAGLAISEKMRSQIRGLNQAKRNAQDGISMIQTFEGALTETHSILQRMKELASESANGTYDNATDRAAIQLEFEQLNDELDQIADTDFNGVTALNGGTMADPDVSENNGKLTFDAAENITSATKPVGNTEAKAASGGDPAVPAGTTVSFSNAYTAGDIEMTYTDSIVLQVGARSKDAVNFTFAYEAEGIGDLEADLDVSSRGLSTKNLDLSSQATANYAIDQIDFAINKTSMVRATFGAVQNRLEHKIENLTTTSENMTEAESNIRDTDMASEMMNYTKYNILQQAAQSMLAQANQQPQSILQLLG